MGVFLYYLPSLKDVTPSDIDRFGLASIFAGEVRPAHGACIKGPDKGPGRIVAPAATNAEKIKQPISYQAARQVWIRPAEKQYWLGMDKHEPPTPEHLKRETATWHYPAWTLGDGREWKCPTARLFPDGTPLPQEFRFDPAGNRVRAVLPEYAALWKHADQVWEMFSDSSIEIPNDETFAICVDCLAVNYRLTEVECLALKLINDRTRAYVLWSLVDFLAWKEVQELVQKKSPSADDGSNTEHGAEES